MAREIEFKYRVKRRLRAKSHLGSKCAVCGGGDDLQFDHIDPKSKVIAISDAIAKHWSWERLLVELDKCQLLCSEHHLEKSIREGAFSVSWNRIDDPLHGTQVMYAREKCRCPDCREWRRLYRFGYVDGQGAVLKAGSPPALRRNPAPEHGYSGYKSRGCRCEVCTQANKEYQRAYRKTRGMAQLVS